LLSKETFSQPNIIQAGPKPPGVNKNVKRHKHMLPTFLQQRVDNPLATAVR